MNEVPDFTPETTDQSEDLTVGALYDSIETNMWLADAYFLRGAKGLAIECLRSAWLEYLRFREVLHVYAGDELGRRLLQALVSRAGDDAGALALGEGAEAETLRRLLAAGASETAPA